MQVGALAMGIGVFLLFPAVPWMLFPGHRKMGGVVALVWAGVCSAWVLNTYGAGAVRFVATVILSSSIRVFAEMLGVFDQWREVRAHRNSCTESASCGAAHQTDRIPYVLVALISTTFLLVLYAAWP
ncbi:hypothetical protein ACWDBF_09765 [Streptomyces angustmyceticus]|uniref:hypothetical protein n=1 Tax=Streptomyces angustmyceticus TaxID=285578 RepID=UPI00368CE781